MVMMKILATVLLPLLVWPSHSPGQVSAVLDRPDASRAQSAAGTTLVHFGQVDDGVYKGSRPKTNADFEFLQSRHIKYIVDLQFLPFLHWSEQKKAKRYDIEFIPARMNASPVSPSQQHVEAIMAILRDKRYQPVYFHCALGRDRTSVIAALYKMYFLGMSQQDARQYMLESGYKVSWVRSGLARYLKKHPTPSPALSSSP
jgi:protein-tyrosine phosphatase